MQVTAIEAQKRNPQRVNVYLDGEFAFGAGAEVVYGRPLRIGDELGAADLERLVQEDRAWQAREAALNLLSYRARSRDELRSRLQRKGFEPALVDACLDDLTARGFLDDRGFAGAFVRDRLRSRPRGRQLLRMELRAKGVDDAIAADVLDEEVPDENVHAAAAAEKWQRRGARSQKALSDDDARAKLYQHLRRRGFGPDAIRHAIDLTLNDD